MNKPQKPAAHRVALFTNYIPPYRESLFRALATRVERLLIYTSLPVKPDRRPAVLDELDVKVQRNLSLRSRWHHPHGFSEKRHIEVPYDTLWLLVRDRPSVIISGELGFRTLQAALYCLISRRSRLIIWATLSEHTENGRGRLRVEVRRLLLRCADAVLVNGESGEQYIARFGVPHERVFRAPYTTDMAPFTAMSAVRSPGEARRLLYTGQLINRKGLVPFLAVLARWCEEHPDRAVEFWLAGSGNLDGALQEGRVPTNVTLRFLGNIDYRDLPRVYSQCGIFVFPTLADEWGVVVNEALASGLPVLGSIYSQAVEELITEGVTGWKFRADVPDEIYAALARALTATQDALASMRLNCIAAVQDLSPEVVADGIVDAVRFVET